MTAPPGHASPYPSAPPPADEPPQWFKWAWQAVSRVLVFAAGAGLALLPGATDVRVTTGAGLMLAAAGIAIAKGWK